MGAVTAAYQMTKVDYAATGSTDQDATHVGVSIAVNDSLSVSAGQQSIEFDGKAEDEKNKGIGASYTMGSISQCMVVSINLRTKVEQVQQQMLKLLSLISRLHSNHLIS